MPVGVCLSLGLSSDPVLIAGKKCGGVESVIRHIHRSPYCKGYKDLLHDVTSPPGPSHCRQGDWVDRGSDRTGLGVVTSKWRISWSTVGLSCHARLCWSGTEWQCYQPEGQLRRGKGEDRKEMSNALVRGLRKSKMTEEERDETVMSKRP